MSESHHVSLESRQHSGQMVWGGWRIPGNRTYFSRECPFRHHLLHLAHFTWTETCVNAHLGLPYSRENNLYLSHSLFVPVFCLFGVRRLSVTPDNIISDVEEFRWPRFRSHTARNFSNTYLDEIEDRGHRSTRCQGRRGFPRHGRGWLRPSEIVKTPPAPDARFRDSFHRPTQRSGP